ncbi:hypothetical protein JZ751_021435, partial [Albula glossodonta]
EQVLVLEKVGSQLRSASLEQDEVLISNLLLRVHSRWHQLAKSSLEREQHLEEARQTAKKFQDSCGELWSWLLETENELDSELRVGNEVEEINAELAKHEELRKALCSKLPLYYATVFQRELSSRTSSVQALKRAANELMGAGPGGAGWVGVLLQELNLRWDRVCNLSITKQTRLQQALKQAEQFRNTVQQLLVWLSGAGQARFRGAPPEEAETLQALLHAHEGVLEALEEKREEVLEACALGETILSSCHPDSITLIRQRVSTLQTRYREVLMWAKQHKQALESSLAEILNNSILLEELLSWLLWAETTLVQREAVPFPHDTLQIKTLIIEHQSKLNIALNRLEELEEGAEFDFEAWRRKCAQWVSRRRCHMMDSDLNVPSTDADKIKDEVTRQVVQCRCMKRFQVEQIGESKYRLGQFECSLRMLCNVLLVQMCPAPPLFSGGLGGQQGVARSSQRGSEGESLEGARGDDITNQDCCGVGPEFYCRLDPVVLVLSLSHALLWKQDHFTAS